MKKCIVIVPKLNKRSSVPASFADNTNITGFVLKGVSFDANEAPIVNPNIGKWYRDRDDNFYWAGGLNVLDETEFTTLPNAIENPELERFNITPAIKLKTEQVINAFESGSASGNYAALVRYKDHTDPVTNQRTVQVTYGRSQTTEYGHLKALVQDYINKQGTFAGALTAYTNRIGKNPSLATDQVFCDTLVKAGKDPVMVSCQDNLFLNKYYLPAFSWFLANGFKLPLSMLVIYDSFIHSGGILAFLRKRFPQVVPASGGDERKWITAYVNTRHSWLSNHSDALLRKTNYRTRCFLEQIEEGNWGMEEPVNANGIIIK
jgi:chitosanase